MRHDCPTMWGIDGRLMPTGLSVRDLLLFYEVKVDAKEDALIVPSFTHISAANLISALVITRKGISLPK